MSSANGRRVDLAGVVAWRPAGTSGSSSSAATLLESLDRRRGGGPRRWGSVSRSVAVRSTTWQIGGEGGGPRRPDLGDDLRTQVRGSRGTGSSGPAAPCCALGLDLVVQDGRPGPGRSCSGPIARRGCAERRRRSDDLERRGPAPSLRARQRPGPLRDAGRRPGTVHWGRPRARRVGVVGYRATAAAAARRLGWGSFILFTLHWTRRHGRRSGRDKPRSGGGRRTAGNAPGLAGTPAAEGGLRQHGKSETVRVGGAGRCRRSWPQLSPAARRPQEAERSPRRSGPGRWSRPSRSWR